MWNDLGETFTVFFLITISKTSTTVQLCLALDDTASSASTATFSGSIEKKEEENNKYV